MEESSIQLQETSQSKLSPNVSKAEDGLRGSQIVKFYEGIGQMARMLHSATHSLDELSSQTIQDTSDLLYRQPESNFLEYVRKLTAKSTSEVLDILETSTPAAREAFSRSEEIEQGLTDYFSQFSVADGGEKMSEAQTQLFDLVSKQKSDLELITKSQQEILELQSFQDLSSQAISKAELLINDLEQNLASLLASFALVSNITDKDDAVDDSALQIDEVPAEQLGQDDVDSLLSDLGF